jgi:hypothetical protein
MNRSTYSTSLSSDVWTHSYEYGRRYVPLDIFRRANEPFLTIVQISRVSRTYIKQRLPEYNSSNTGTKTQVKRVTILHYQSANAPQNTFDQMTR